MATLATATFYNRMEAESEWLFPWQLREPHSRGLFGRIAKALDLRLGTLLAHERNGGQVYAPIGDTRGEKRGGQRAHEWYRVCSCVSGSATAP